MLHTAKLQAAGTVGVLALYLAAGSVLNLRAQAPIQRPVILISIDTLRADHLSSYGYKGLQTPNIDALAKGGTLFGQVSSQVPLTLPSHVSLLTSTLPSYNGIEDNGEALGPNLVTLAAVLAAQGYRTAAFVGGFVLDKRFGLGRGFQTYDSPFRPENQGGIDPMDLKRQAEQVTGAAKRWLDANSHQPFFLFVHLYDLHTPYKLSPELRARFPHRGYDAALSYVDGTLGEFAADLARRGLWDKSLIVLLSDHGEGLGDHGEDSHGYFIYQSTLRVPLLIHWPQGTGPMPAKVEAPVSLLDVAPTILQFLRVARPAQFQGRSLLELFRRDSSPGPREIYSESLYAHNHFGCSPLRSIRVGAYKFIDAPRPELYDLNNDPRELNNLYSTHRDAALELRERLGALRARYASAQPSSPPAPDPELAQRLASLGYVSATSGHPARDSGVDPKDRILEYERYRRALALGLAGNLEQSAALLKEVAAKVPDLADVWSMLGMTQQRMGQQPQAVASFQQALKIDPMHVLAHYYLAESYFSLNHPDAAVRELQAALAIADKSGSAMNQVSIPAQELLGRIYMQQAEWEKARAVFVQLLNVAPGDYYAHYDLAWLEGRDGHLEQALEHMQKAVQAAPQSAEAHNALGSVYLSLQNLPAAQAEISQAITLDPQFALAWFNRGRLLLQMGRKDDAAAAFRRALAIEPRLQAARDALNQLQPAAP